MQIDAAQYTKIMSADDLLPIVSELVTPFRVSPR
jgi:hypothetical protein